MRERLELPPNSHFQPRRIFGSTRWRGGPPAKHDEAFPLRIATDGQGKMMKRPTNAVVGNVDRENACDGAKVDEVYSKVAFARK